MTATSIATATDPARRCPGPVPGPAPLVRHGPRPRRADHRHRAGGARRPARSVRLRQNSSRSACSPGSRRPTAAACWSTGPTSPPTRPTAGMGMILASVAASSRTSPWLRRRRLRYRGCAGLRPGSGRCAAAWELLELVGLVETTNRLPHQRYSGQQQQITLARALAIGAGAAPPGTARCSAVDAQFHTQAPRAGPAQVQTATASPTLFVSHDAGARRLSITDRVGVMQSGRLEQIAPPDGLLHGRRPRSWPSSLGLTNRLPGTAGDGIRGGPRRTGPAPRWVGRSGCGDRARPSRSREAGPR